MLRNGLYNAAGSLARTGLAILTVPLLTHTIGVDEYGLWSLVWAVVGVVGLVEAGLSISTTVFLARDSGTGDSEQISQTLTAITGSMLLLATIAAVALYGSAAALAGSFSNLSASQQEVAQRALQAGAILIWTRLLQQVLIGVEQARERYDIMSTLVTLQAIAGSAGMLGIALVGGRSDALMEWQAAVGVGILIAHVIAAAMLLRHLKLRPSWCTAKSLAIGRYSALAWLSTLGGTLFGQGDRIIVGGLLGTGALGTYAAITSIAAQINVLSALPVQPVLPSLASMISKRTVDGPQIRRHLRLAFGINTVTALGLGIVLLAFAEQITGLLVPHVVTEESVTAFRIATVVYALYSLNAVGYYILFALDALPVNLVINLGSSLFTLLLIAMLSSQAGLIGSVAGNAGYLLSLLFIPFGLRQLGVVLRRRENAFGTIAE